MVASLKALMLTVAACTEAEANVILRARNTGIRIPNPTGKEEDRTGVLVNFNSIGTPKKGFGKSKCTSLLMTRAVLNIDRMRRITRNAELAKYKTDWSRLFLRFFYLLENPLSVAELSSVCPNCSELRLKKGELNARTTVGVSRRLAIDLLCPIISRNLSDVNFSFFGSFSRLVRNQAGFACPHVPFQRGGAGSF
jgi:hypothetical protein